MTLPEPVLAPVELLGALAVPAMLLAFGISLHGASRPGRDRESRLPLVAIVTVKTVVHPLMALGLGLVLGLEGVELLAVVVCAALPAAQNVFGYAVRFGHGVTLARDAVLVTTLLSLPVIFAAVALLL
ncbi:AEC family transporter [Saccharomonospora azurea]|uniref:AEC family transporter n=1 Tax=Saccharomonospora azurea TaxID=40988 RepID=UPI0002F9680E